MAGTSRRLCEGVKMAGKLKPCPFCGQIPDVDEYRDMFGRKYYGVSCNNEYCKIQPFTDGLPTEEKAIREWNERKKERNEKSNVITANGWKK